MLIPFRLLFSEWITYCVFFDDLGEFSGKLLQTSAYVWGARERVLLPGGVLVGMDSSGGRATSIVAAVATAAGVCAAWYLATTQVKKRRASPLTQMKKRRTVEEEEHSSSQSETKFAIVDELLGADAFLDVVRLMPAASAARLARVSSAVHARLSDPSVVLWCAESRKKVLLRRAETGSFAR